MTAGCSKSADTFYAEGTRFRQSGKRAEAVIAYGNALQREPTRADAQLALADTLLEMGDASRGLNELIKAADLLPARNDLQVRIGSILLLGGRFDEARLRAERVLAREPALVDALVLRANALAGLSRIDAAIEQVEQAITLEPKAGLYTNLGTLQQLAGSAREAEASFRRAISLDPKSVTASLALANFQWSAGRMADAEAQFRHAYALDPAHPLVARALVTFYVATGKLPQAEPYLIAWTKAGGGPTSKLALAAYYARLDRVADAETVLNGLAQIPSRWAVARARIAALRLQQGKPSEALAIADEVLAKQAGQVEALVTRTRALLALGRPDDAYASAQAALVADAKQIEARYLLGTILAARGDLAGATTAFQEVLRLNPHAAAAQVQLARLELLRGVPAASAQLAADALANDPGNAQARLMLVRAAMAQRQYARARTELATLLQKYPDAAAVHQQLGLLEREEGQPAAARRAFQRALVLDPGARDSLTALVALDVVAKRPDAAWATLAPRLAASPRESWLQVLAARVSVAEGKPADAEKRLREAIAADPSALDAYRLLGQIYLSQRRLDEARREFDQLAAKDPRGGALTMAAMILQMQGKREDARQRYEQVVQRDPGAAVAANNLAWIYAEQKSNLGAALQLAQAAHGKLPNHPDVIDTLGYVYLQQGNARLAVPFLEDAVKRDPENAVYRHHLGLAYQALGDVDGARRELRAALDKNPAYAAGNGVKAALEALR